MKFLSNDKQNVLLTNCSNTYYESINTYLKLYWSNNIANSEAETLWMQLKWNTTVHLYIDTYQNWVTYRRRGWGYTTALLQTYRYCKQNSSDEIVVVMACIGNFKFKVMVTRWLPLCFITYVYINTKRVDFSYKPTLFLNPMPMNTFSIFILNFQFIRRPQWPTMLYVEHWMLRFWVQFAVGIIWEMNFDGSGCSG